MRHNSLHRYTKVSHNEYERPKIGASIFGVALTWQIWVLVALVAVGGTGGILAGVGVFSSDVSVTSSPTTGSVPNKLTFPGTTFDESIHDTDEFKEALQRGIAAGIGGPVEAADVQILSITSGSIVVEFKVVNVTPTGILASFNAIVDEIRVELATSTVTELQELGNDVIEVAVTAPDGVTHENPLTNTAAPTTASPTTASPTTAAPIVGTAAPTLPTASPTTAAPTTAFYATTHWSTIENTRCNTITICPSCATGNNTEYTTPSLCKAACELDGDCVGFNFHRGQWKCYYLTNIITGCIEPNSNLDLYTRGEHQLTSAPTLPTASPTTASPTTASPTTVSPTTVSPTTGSPTTTPPTRSPTTGSPTIPGTIQIQSIQFEFPCNPYSCLCGSSPPARQILQVTTGAIVSNACGNNVGDARVVYTKHAQCSWGTWAKVKAPDVNSVISVGPGITAEFHIAVYWLGHDQHKDLLVAPAGTGPYQYGTNHDDYKELHQYDGDTSGTDTTGFNFQDAISGVVAQLVGWNGYPNVPC